MKKKLLMLAATTVVPALWARARKKRSAENPRNNASTTAGLPEPRLET